MSVHIYGSRVNPDLMLDAEGNALMYDARRVMRERERETTEKPMRDREIRVRYNLPLDGGQKMYAPPEGVILTQEEREILHGRS